MVENTDETALNQLIRQGRTFAIYRGHNADGLPILSKVPVGGAAFADALSRLSNEFEITRNLDHPLIVVAQTLVTTLRFPILIFPDEGLNSLESLLQTRDLAPHLLKVARSLAEALDYIHAKGIIHRDIKPSNVVVDAAIEQIRLIDFCLAIHQQDLDAEESGAFAAQGTVAYMAPEQTGRMNRTVDHRSDLYSLGVTLYELATGQLPFKDDDPSVLFHRHLTQTPVAPEQLNPDVPSALSNAILRLLEKNPEDRFQSARDFVAALVRLDGGADTISSVLTIPETLYGRQDVVAALHNRIVEPGIDASRLIRIAGQSGVGKSALVRQLRDPITAAGGRLIEGKFDQLDRARPYSALVQAFNALLRVLLGGTSEQVDLWRRRLLDALSPNARVLLDVLPEYEALIGAQPSVAKLGLNEAQIRMSMVFRRFVRALATRDEPLVLFLDDLQWCDSASRELIKLLHGDPDIRHLTIVTAYRDNEVGPGHPTAMLFAELEKNGELLPAHVIGPLDRGHVTSLLSDALHRSRQDAAPLALLIHAKTGGNPFFVRQFLGALYRKALVSFNSEHSRWEWDMQQITNERITDNVADLVVERILELPEETQSLVHLAACCGNEFEAEILSITSNHALVDVERTLLPAIKAEIVQPLPQSPSMSEEKRRYRFHHDRMQQAVYAILPAQRRTEIHASIGELLLEMTSDPKPEGRLIEITDHLIAGRSCLSDNARDRLQDLALRSARASKAANAYEAALAYLDVAQGMLEDDAWHVNRTTAYLIALEKAEAAYLQSQTNMAEQILSELLARDLTPLEEVRALGLRILLLTSKLAYRAALLSGLQALSRLGEKLPLHPRLPMVLAELLRTKARLARRSDLSLLRLPRMTDPEKLAAMQILVLLAPPAYFSAPNLLPLIALRMVQLSVKHGNAPHSAYGYVIYGMLHCAVLGDPKRGLAYGELARQAAIDLDAQDIEGRVLMVFAGFIQHWTSPLRDTLPIFLDGADKALSAGDLEYHGYTRYGHASYALMSGQPLPWVSDYLDHHLAAVTDSRHEKTRRIMLMARSSVARMRGFHDETATVPADEVFDEQENYALWSAQNDATSLAYFHKYKMLEAVMSGDFSTVRKETEAIERNLNGILSMGYQPYYQFYEALALLHLSPEASTASRLRLKARAGRLTRRLERWSKNAPQNFLHRAMLLRAEMASLDREDDRAMGLFDGAIAAARRADALHDVGLMLERAAQFFLARGAEDTAASYLAEAVVANTQWGGNGWNEALKQRYPGLISAHMTGVISEHKKATRSGSSSTSSEVVDSTTLIRAASALSENTSLGDVVREVMRALVINAGAVRGTLLISREDTLCVAAECESSDDVRLLEDWVPPDGETLPLALINYVARSRERLVIDDATVDQHFGTDPYIQTFQPRSALCVPLLRKGEVTGVVYLENARVRGVFTPDRCRIVELLGAQAAISIENASLYDNLRKSLETQVELTSAHARFVPHQFLETLGHGSISDVKLGDHVRAEASILFSDIRGFTALIERMTPEEAIEFINTYLSKMEPAVQTGGGFVDSYVGDAVMAVFERGPDAALQAGITMLRRLREWARVRESDGAMPIRIGIGIATGDMIFGTIGAANRMKCGVIGDTVNLAARIEGLTKHYNLGMLISQGTYRSLSKPEKFSIREVDLVTVVGRSAPVRIFEVVDADPHRLRAQKMMNSDAISNGLRLYRSGAVEQAHQIFEQCRMQGPDDPLLIILTERCRQHDARARDPGWDGIEHIERK